VRGVIMSVAFKESKQKRFFIILDSFLSSCPECSAAAAIAINSSLLNIFFVFPFEIYFVTFSESHTTGYKRIIKLLINI
jgi:hypothetical protein